MLINELTNLNNFLEVTMKTTYFGIWCEGSSYIDNCPFVTRDIRECIDEGTKLMTFFITSGQDDDQNVRIIGVNLTNKQYNKLLTCVDGDGFDSDFVKTCVDRGSEVMEFNCDDRDKFYYTSGYSDDEEPDYDNPQYEDPDWETNVEFCVRQIVEMKVSDFEL
jgi:hypothetical protein